MAGCSSTSTGLVTGVVHMSGGPPSETGRPFYTGQPSAGQEVVVLDEHRSRTIATSDASGRYWVALPPGTYTLMCGTMPRFTVAAGQNGRFDCDLVVS